MERAGLKQLYESSQSAAAGAKAEALAAVPSTAAHFALDALFERPVQAELVGVLLTPSGSEHFTSCVVVVHGMGGTGKTVRGLSVAVVIPESLLPFVPFPPDRSGDGSGGRAGEKSAGAFQ